MKTLLDKYDDAASIENKAYDAWQAACEKSKYGREGNRAKKLEKVVDAAAWNTMFFEIELQKIMCWI